MASPLQQYTEWVSAHGGTAPIRRILVANNGMAAAKFILSIRNWLFESFGDDKLIHIISMATPEDMKASAKHLALADAFYEARRLRPAARHPGRTLQSCHNACTLIGFQWVSVGTWFWHDRTRWGSTDRSTAPYRCTIHVRIHTGPYGVPRGTPGVCQDPTGPRRHRGTLLNRSLTGLDGPLLGLAQPWLLVILREPR